MSGHDLQDRGIAEDDLGEPATVGGDVSGGDADTSQPGTAVAPPDRRGGEPVGPRPGACVGAPGALLVIISGPSGVGKDTIIRRLRERHPNADRHFVVTYKTRPARNAEVDGVDYHFVTEDHFHRLRQEGRLLEATPVHDHWAGTPRDQVEAALEAGRDAVLKIDVKGAQRVRALVPEALLIFVAPPSPEELVERLQARGTETPEQLEQRRRDAVDELAHRSDYDYVVTNERDRAAETADMIDAIISAEHARHPDRRISF